jgi:hypothetical protein
VVETGFSIGSETCSFTRSVEERSSKYLPTGREGCRGAHSGALTSKFSSLAHSEVLSAHKCAQQPPLVAFLTAPTGLELSARVGEDKAEFPPAEGPDASREKETTEIGMGTIISQLSTDRVEGASVGGLNGDDRIHSRVRLREQLMEVVIDDVFSNHKEGLDEVEGHLIRQLSIKNDAGPSGGS